MSSVKQSYDNIVDKQYDKSYKESIKRNNIVKRESLMFCFKDNGQAFKSILDLCGGKGGDIYKLSFVSDKNTSLTVIDFSSQSLEEYSRRLEDAPFKFKETNLINFDAGDPKIIQILANSSFDLINMQFCLHYFFESKPVLNTIFELFKAYATKYIIITTTDDQMLRQSTDPNFTLLDKQSRAIYGNQVRFFVPGAVETTEYLVPRSFLLEQMKQLGFDCIYDKLFSEMNLGPPLPKRSIDISKYYRLYIFKRT